MGFAGRLHAFLVDGFDDFEEHVIAIRRLGASRGLRQKQSLVRLQVPRKAASEMTNSNWPWVILGATLGDETCHRAMYSATITLFLLPLPRRRRNSGPTLFIKTGLSSIPFDAYKPPP